MPLRDATGAGFAPTDLIAGTNLVSLWTPRLTEGRFRVALDLDGNGVFDGAYDEVSIAFTVHEGLLPGLLGALFLPLGTILCRRCRSPSPATRR
jgi:hypothetical protein